MHRGCVVLFAGTFSTHGLSHRLGWAGFGDDAKKDFAEEIHAAPWIHVSTTPPSCTITLCPNYRTYHTSQFKVLVVLLSISAPFLLLSAHGARASGPLIVTHGPERRRPPPGQARSGRQRPHALLGRRGQRRPAMLGASVWWQYNVAGRQSPRRRGPLTDEFASTTTPVFFCTTTAPAAEAHSSASADADWVSNHQRGVRKRNVDFL